MIPYTIYLIKTMITGETTIEVKGKNCDCTKCKETIKRRQKIYRKSWIRGGFFFKIAVGAALWYVWYLIAL